MARTPKVVEDRREQIAAAALRVFAQKGFTRATNRDIAREAGITPGLIYHYFASKEALLQAIVDLRSPAQLTRALSPEILALPPEPLIRTLLLQMLTVVEGERFIQLLRVFLPVVLILPLLCMLLLFVFVLPLLLVCVLLLFVLVVSLLAGMLWVGLGLLVFVVLIGAMLFVLWFLGIDD